jgi:hypothetical protein
MNKELESGRAVNLTLVIEVILNVAALCAFGKAVVVVREVLLITTLMKAESLPIVTLSPTLSWL